MQENDRYWVIAWRPFDPNGVFVKKIGNLNKPGEHAIVAEHGLTNALRMGRAEAQFLLSAIRELPGATYHKELILVDVRDHR